MKNTAYYLKYRPSSLDELIGQEVVKKTLLSSFKANRLAHAYLFVGPRGTGKTSTARILAKMVNCELVSDSFTVSSNNDEQTNELTLKVPCNKCSTCLSITDGSNLDLIEIDAASNRGIEDIRVLRERINLAPTASKKKVYIVDEVHMLTQEAFNALLKTLEEPPSHALFILATTEGSKIPQTILSRVQRLDFKLATHKQLLEALQKIVKMEKIDIDEDGLKLLAKSADGSFRDGVKLLDQISTIQGKITASVLDKFLKETKFEKLAQLVWSFSKKDTTHALTQVTQEVEDGVDIKELLISLMDFLRNIVFIKNGLGEQLVKENYTEEDYQTLTKISESFTNLDLVKNLDCLQKALEKMKTASIPSLPLELAVVEICGSENSENSVSQMKSEYKQSLRDESLKQSLPSEEGQKINEPVDKKIEIRSEKMDSASHISPPTSDSPDIQKLKEKWGFVLETVRQYNFSLEALLRTINLTNCTDIAVTLEVPYSFHQRILEAPKNRELLEGILAEILGRPMRVSTVLGSRPVRGEDIANIEITADDEIIRAAAEIFNSDTVN